VEWPNDLLSSIALEVGENQVSDDDTVLRDSGLMHRAECCCAFPHDRIYIYRFVHHGSLRWGIELASSLARCLHGDHTFVGSFLCDIGERCPWHGGRAGRGGELAAGAV